MEDYKELISLCDYWIGLSDENDKKTMDDQLLNRCKCAIEHLVEEYKILEWQNHLERCEHQHTKEECDDCATKTYACIVKLEEKLAKVTKERDVALADLHLVANNCFEDYVFSACICCKKNDTCNGQPSTGCEFEWRGV